MTAGFGTGSWSSTSHASDPPGVFRARIEAINDPKNRNRVQVRIFGYQDDQGNIPKDQLEWVHVLSHDSQIPGATSTHNYYPGAEVFVMNTGTEKVIMGSTPGFDGENRLQNNPWGADTSTNNKSDLPNIIRGDADTTVRHSPGIMGAAGAITGLSAYFAYQNWKNQVKMNAYATGKGGPPAPFGMGTVTKSDALKTIGVNKTVTGSDVLNIIKTLDGNASGAIKAAISIILNLRNAGFGSAMSMIGAGLFASALTQYTNQYGAYTQNDLVNLLQQLLTYMTQVQQFTVQNFQSNVASGLVLDIIAFLSNTEFGISTDTLNDMNNINTIMMNSSGTASAIIQFFQGQLNQFQSDFNHCVNQAFTAILQQINQLAIAFPNISDFITMFGGTTAFITFAQLLLQVATLLGIPQTAINTVGANTIGMALGGGLNILPVIQPPGPTVSTTTSTVNPLIGLLAIFNGNPIAKAELLGGGLIKTFLSGNPMKYQSVPRNDGPGVLKKFGDSPAAPPTADAGTTIGNPTA